ncbi:hypothetical protein M422DRAFT_55428 [Sphaerobolus stellatus SS14]|uniref:Uncharacterized protein n=1 Tax=Sphaerobolus stellatus (strain SS14) TaxID=990650 RepID=A0A0C9UMA6_SPHS4|nr:hypothetical protein M422DRAFT_55428 [Sphaerobolus stellatus SS14]
MPTCFCKVRGCGGIGGRELTQKQLNQHLREERVSTYRLEAESRSNAKVKPEALIDNDIKEEVFRMVFEQPPPALTSMDFEQQERTSRFGEKRPPTASPNPFKTEDVGSPNIVLSPEVESMKAALTDLQRIHAATKEVMQTVEFALSDPCLGQGIPAVPENHPLTPHSAWLNSQKVECITYQTIASPSLQIFAQTILEEIEQSLNAIEHHRSAWAEPGLSHYNSGK